MPTNGSNNSYLPSNPGAWLGSIGHGSETTYSRQITAGQLVITGLVKIAYMLLISFTE